MMIRLEELQDYAAVFTINESTFETPAEANLVNRLRKEAHPYLSLVSVLEGNIVGHILFTPVTLIGFNQLKIMGLAPMAVKLDHQGNGIGSALVKTGLQHCKEMGYGAVVVLGHTWFYPRFGFVPSIHYGIGCEYDVPPDVFMVNELQAGYLHAVQGIIQFHSAFKEL